MSSARRSNRRQQTRLTFSPLPSSSPAVSDYPDQIQRRAAAVRYDQSPSPSKKRRTTNAPPRQTVLTSANIYGLNTPTKSSQVMFVVDSPEPRKHLRKDSFSDEAPLPTPLVSSQTEMGDAQEHNILSSESDTALQSKLKSSPVELRKKGTDHEAATPSSFIIPAGRFEANDLNPRPADSTGMKRNFEKDILLVSDEDEMPLSSVRRRGIGSTPAALTSDDELGPTPAEPTTPCRNRPSSAAVIPLRFFAGGRSGAAPLSDLQRRKPVSSSEKRNDASRAIAITSTSKRFMRSSTGSRGNQNVVDVSTDNESEPETLPSFRTRSTRKLRPSNSKVANKATTTDEDGNIGTKTGRVVRSKSKAVTIVSSGSERSDGDLVISPTRRRLTKKVVESPSSDSQNSANELQEDLDALRETQVLKNRTRTRTDTSKRSERQAQLEILKRRRAGEKMGPNNLERRAEPADQPRQGQSTDDEVSEESADSATEAIRQTLSGSQNPNEYVDDDDFLDDEEDTIGAPLGLEDMPLEFTRHAHKKPIEHFKDIVEWMIHNKLNPAFARHDPIYQIAVRKLDDEVQGYSGSKFQSSAWNADFLKVLKARPELYRLDVPTMFDHKCDACNRSGHPAKHQLTFSGKPYNRDTLENLTDDEDEEGDDDDEEKSRVDDEGRSTSNQEQSFYLGRTCTANAETAHALYHWRHALNQYVLNWLKHNGHTTPKKIVERENWSARKREKYANKVVDGMEERGETKVLYKEFKQNLDIAREARPERFTYGRR